MKTKPKFRKYYWVVIDKASGKPREPKILFNTKTEAISSSYKDFVEYDEERDLVIYKKYLIQKVKVQIAKVDKGLAGLDEMVALNQEMGLYNFKKGEKDD